MAVTLGKSKEQELTLGTPQQGSVSAGTPGQGSVSMSTYVPNWQITGDNTISDVGYGDAAAATTPTKLTASQIAASKASKTRGDIRNRGAELNAIYNALFGDLDTLLKARSGELETQYGKQFEDAAKSYASSIPTIQNSYAAIGAADSTDTSDAKDNAKDAFDTTNRTIGENKTKDLTAVGQYGREQRAKIQADQDALNYNLGQLDSTTDQGALDSMRGDVESRIGSANTTRATLGTDGTARNELSALTADNGRFESASNALDSLLKSSMSGAVKQAAVKSIVDNAGLSDDDKQKINMQYGNVYNESNV